MPFHAHRPPMAARPRSRRRRTRVFCSILAAALGLLALQAGHRQAEAADVRLSADARAMLCLPPLSGSDLTLPSCYYRLPGCHYLGEPKIRDMARLSATQGGMLEDISVECLTTLQRSRAEADKEWRDLPPSRRTPARAKQLADKVAAVEREFRNTVPGQVRPLLTQQQMANYEDLVFTAVAYEVMQRDYREVIKAIGATRGQEEQLARIDEELRRQAQEIDQELGRECIAVLSDQQQETLRAEVARERHSAEPATGGGATVVTVAEPSATTGITLRPAAVESLGDAGLVLPVYGELAQAAVRQKLGLTRSQEKQLRAVSAEYQATLQKVNKFLQAAAQEDTQEPGRFQRKVAQCDRARAEAADVARGQIEAMLGPQQMTSLREMAFRFGAARALLSPVIQAKLDITDEQRERLDQLAENSRMQIAALNREAVANSIGLFTPVQSRALRGEAGSRGD